MPNLVITKALLKSKGPCEGVYTYYRTTWKTPPRLHEVLTQLCTDNHIEWAELMLLWFAPEQHLAAYRKAIAPHKDAYWEAIAPHMEAYWEATAPHKDAYWEAIAPHMLSIAAELQKEIA